MTLGARRLEISIHELSAAHRAAVLVMYLDTPVAKDFVGRLSQAEIEEIRECMDDVVDLEPSLIAQVVAEFMRDRHPTSDSQARSPSARRAVSSPERAPQSASPVRSEVKSARPQLKFLEHYTTQQITKAFAQLTHQQIAVALLSFDVDFAASILAELSESEQHQVCLRMARTSQIGIATISEIAETLEEILNQPSIEEKQEKPARQVVEGLSALVKAQTTAKVRDNAQSNTLKKSSASPPTPASPIGQLAVRSTTTTSASKPLSPSMAADPSAIRAYARWKASLSKFTPEEQPSFPTIVSEKESIAQTPMPDPEQLFNELQVGFYATNRPKPAPSAARTSEADHRAQTSVFVVKEPPLSKPPTSPVRSVDSRFADSRTTDSEFDALALTIKEVAAQFGARTHEEHRNPLGTTDLAAPPTFQEVRETPHFHDASGDLEWSTDDCDSEPVPSQVTFNVQPLKPSILTDNSTSYQFCLTTDFLEGESPDANPELASHVFAAPKTVGSSQIPAEPGPAFPSCSEFSDKYATGIRSLEPPASSVASANQPWPGRAPPTANSPPPCGNRASRRKKADRHRTPPCARGPTATARGPTRERSQIPAHFALPLGGLLALRTG